jgi:type I restriction enzyme S subunit
MSSDNGSNDWKLVPLDDLCERGIKIRDPRANPDTPFVYVDISSVDNRRKQIVNPQRVSGQNASSRARQIIAECDVLVATTRPNLNAVALVPRELHDQIASTGLCVLRARNNLDPEYLFGFVQSPDFVRKLSELVRGALYPAVTESQVRAQKIPLPPLEEQRQIAARLREQLSILAEARTALEAQLKTAKALPAANLRAVFESEEAQRWPRAKLEELCEIVATQVDPTDSKFADFPHINGENIESGTLELNGIRSAREDGMMSGKYLFEQGDVLYSKLRPYLRKVAIAPWRGLCSADMYPLRMRRDRLHEKYAAWLLLSDEFTKYAVGESQRSRMPKLNREQLFAWNAPVPSLETQRAIAIRLDAEFSASGALREFIHGKLSELEKLPAALLRSAFSVNGG